MSIHIQSLLEEMMSAELEPPVRELFARVRELDQGCSVLRVLFRRPNVMLTLDDIAYHAARPSAVVEGSILAMVEMGLAREIVVAGIAWFGLTKDQEIHQSVSKLIRWQDRCHRRLAEIARMVDGQPVAREGVSKRPSGGRLGESGAR